MTELDRRDALAALAAAGASAAGGAGLAGCSAPGGGPTTGGDGDEFPTPEETALDDETVDVLVAFAEVLYPSAVEGVRPFVETYAAGRTAHRPERAGAVAATVADLDELARSWFGDGVAALPRADRDRLLDQVGADTAEPIPDGSPAERARHYVVNELLYALYASPTGGRLVGIENPPGYPGGLGTYQRGPR